MQKPSKTLNSTFVTVNSNDKIEEFASKETFTYSYSVRIPPIQDVVSIGLVGWSVPESLIADGNYVDIGIHQVADTYTTLMRLYKTQTGFMTKNDTEPPAALFTIPIKRLDTLKIGLKLETATDVPDVAHYMTFKVRHIVTTAETPEWATAIGTTLI